MNNIVAILVDGGFYQRRAKALWGDLTAEERAIELEQYCRFHLDEGDKLYRIFYYDCKPLENNVYHPLEKKPINLKKSDLYTWMTSFHKALMTKRKVALRWGKLSNNDAHYTLRYESVKELLSGKLTLENLNLSHFQLNTIQKGVDMCIGLDISTLAYKGLVNQVVLISGDSDFVPAAKLARREGIDFILDSMHSPISDDLSEHIDGKRTPCKPSKENKDLSPYNSKKKSKKQRRVFD